MAPRVFVCLLASKFDSHRLDLGSLDMAKMQRSTPFRPCPSSPLTRRKRRGKTTRDRAVLDSGLPHGQQLLARLAPTETDRHRKSRRPEEQTWGEYWPHGGHSPTGVEGGCASSATRQHGMPQREETRRGHVKAPKPDSRPEKQWKQAQTTSISDSS